MKISCNTCQKKEKERSQIKFLIYAVRMYANFPPNMFPKNLKTEEQKSILQLCCRAGETGICFHTFNPFKKTFKSAM